jgi:hypothetical protein
MTTRSQLRRAARILIPAAATMLARCTVLRVPPPPAASPSAIGRSLPRAEAIADVDTLMRTLEDVHPDLYAVRSRDATVRALREVTAAFPASMTRAELWMRLAPFVAGFGDGHTSLWMPGDEVARMRRDGALVFPPSVVTAGADQRLVVAAPLGAAGRLDRGDRIRSVNGLPADSLVRAWTSEFSGESDRLRVAEVTNSFRDLSLIHGLRVPYTLEIEAISGQARAVKLAGVPRDSLVALAARDRSSGSATPNFTYRVLGPGVGYMDLGSFSGDADRFADDVAEMFHHVAADSDRTLIIDLRENRGGDSRLGDELLRHITTKRYRMSARKDWKMSAEYRAYLRSFVGWPLSWTRWNVTPLGRMLFSGPDGQLVEFSEQPTADAPRDPFFAGAVCVLIGPRTFSSAVDFADAVKTYHLATLIGE